jgi:hypothetical protein
MDDLLPSISSEDENEVVVEDEEEEEEGVHVEFGGVLVSFLRRCDADYGLSPHNHLHLF